MGVDTIGIIRKRTSAKRIAEYLKESYKDVAQLKYGGNGVYSVVFEDGEDYRMLSIVQPTARLSRETFKVEKRKEEISLKTYTWIDLGYWGNSVEIIEGIVKHFGGGWIDKNDCDMVDYEVIK